MAKVLEYPEQSQEDVEIGDTQKTTGIWK